MAKHRPADRAGVPVSLPRPASHRQGSCGRCNCSSRGGAHAARRGRRSWPVLMALGGWKTERMIRRYASVTDSTLRAAANAVAWEPTAAPWQQPRKAYP
jgi:hypothetical protein